VDADADGETQHDENGQESAARGTGSHGVIGKSTDGRLERVGF